MLILECLVVDFVNFLIYFSSISDIGSNQTIGIQRCQVSNFFTIFQVYRVTEMHLESSLVCLDFFPLKHLTVFQQFQGVHF